MTGSSDDEGSSAEDGGSNDPGGPNDVRDRVTRRTDRILDDLREEWDTGRTVADFEYGPKPWHPDSMPDSVDAQLETWGGIASVITFYSTDREEAVLVYNRSGLWEPPAGAIEGRTSPRETAVREAREESGLDVEVTDLAYTGRAHLQYADGTSVPLPVAAFVGHRVSGTLSVERETSDHPGVTRAVGMFTPEVLPEEVRDRELIEELYAEDAGQDLLEWADRDGS